MKSPSRRTLPRPEIFDQLMKPSKAFSELGQPPRSEPRLFSEKRYQEPSRASALIRIILPAYFSMIALFLRWGMTRET